MPHPHTLTIVLLLGLFSGCDTRPAPEQPAATGRSLAAVFQTLDNPFFVECNEGIREVVTSHGDRLTTLDAHWDNAQQSAAISRLLDQGIAAIFLNPVNGEEIQGSLRQAQQRGVPCVVVDAPVKEPALVLCQVASDNVEAGRLAARALHQARPSATIAVLHIPTNKACIDRVAGFQGELAQWPEMQIVEIADGKGTAEGSGPVLEHLLRQHARMNAVFAVNDPSALGAISALKGAGRLAETTVVSVDGSAQGIAAVQAGTLYSTSVQFPREIGRIAAQRFYEHLDGNPVEKDIKVPLELITSDNVHAFAEGR